MMFNWHDPGVPIPQESALVCAVHILATHSPIYFHFTLIEEEAKKKAEPAK
jgi:hypothetical protein